MRHRIVWLVPIPLKGSGGHRTIFTHIRNLVERGYECRIHVGTEDHQGMTAERLREMIQDYFGFCPAPVEAGYGVTGRFDTAVATAWWTAPIVARDVDAGHKVYFIQDFEPFFNPMGDEYILAENTYRLRLIPITIGRWLSHLMIDRFGIPSHFFDFSADRSLYRPISELRKEKAVCFVHQPEKPRRCPRIGRHTLAILKHHCPDITIYTYGSDLAPDFDFEHTHLGLLTREECNILYNRCSVGLCLSSSNPSRIPFEMMAAGLPVVDFYDDNTIYDYPAGGVLLAEKNAPSLAGALLEIINSRSRREQMGRVGLNFMASRDVKGEFAQCAAIFDALIAGLDRGIDKLSPLYDTPIFSSQRYQPPPAVLPAKETRPENGRNRGGRDLGYWLRHNRLARVLKVLYRGYY